MDDISPTAPSNLRFAPSILKRLGEELNPTIDQGLLELVKNAYDADATECHIWLAANGEMVVVEDNGNGMDRQSIENGWLVLGGSSKQTSDLTKLGRSPAGNKGLGRLAALRLGRKALMLSRPEDGGEFQVVLDWEMFDRAATVDEVVVEIVPDASYNGPTGTRIELHEIRKPIGRVDVRRLARSLVLLADPFADTESTFQPYLHSDEFEDLATQVRERYFDQAEYHLAASLRDGKAHVEAVDWQGEVLWAVGHDELAPDQQAFYGAPDATFDLWAFILSPSNFATRPVQLGAVREWLRQFGGVHVYVNGLRVAPYGNPGNDWLDLNLARVRSPEERPGTNTAIGRLLVSDGGGRLVQKTDRSGFIESNEFEELQRFAKDSLEWLARRRIEAAERKRQSARKESASDADRRRESIQKQIREVPDELAKKQLEKAFDLYDRARDVETDGLRKEVQLYRTLSTAGITAATFAHESTGNPLKVISLSVNVLKTVLMRADQELYQLKYVAPLAKIENAVASLGVLATATLDLIKPDKRRFGKIYLDRSVDAVCRNFEPFLLGRSVDLELDLPTGSHPYARGSAAAIESIVTNLINNSLSAFESVDVQRRLRISSRHDSDVWELKVEDNGPGITGISVDDIWLPGQSRRDGGTGLGLTIVRDSVADLSGEVSVLANGELGGATFVIQIPMLGVDLE